MASTLKTPGVYVEESCKFPPSVAQVETAIPAFIGYTEIAKKYADEDLLNEPTRITSLLDYITYFGSADKETAFTVNVVEDANVPPNVRAKGEAKAAPLADADNPSSSAVVAPAPVSVIPADAAVLAAKI